MHAPADHAARPTLLRLARMWAAERRLAAIGLTCVVAYIALSLAIPALIARAIDLAATDRRSDLWILAALTTLAAVVRMGVNLLRRSATQQIGLRVEARVRAELYAAYLRFPRSFFDSHPTGQVVSRATNDLGPVRRFVGWGVMQTLQSVLMIVGVAIVLVAVNPRLAVLSALALPAIGILTQRFARRVVGLSREVQQCKGDLTEAAEEVVAGIETVQALGREQEMRERFGEAAGKIRGRVVRQARIEARHLPLIGFLPTVSIALVLYLGGRDVIDGALSYGEFALFVQLLLLLAWPLEALGLIVDDGQRAIAAAGRSFAWIDHGASDPAAVPPRAAAPAVPPTLSLRDVCFAYPGAPAVLRDLRLDLAPGEAVAVVGGTGAGKSTLLSLLSGAYEPDTGRVVVNGSDLSERSLSAFRREVAVVTQRPILFSGTLRENLLVGRADATAQELREACAIAGVADFAPTLEAGLETPLGERGMRLSGGQRQRVALARALLSDACVLVLDDPLSAVDAESERQLLLRLRPAVRGRTVLLAAQRSSTLALADRVVLLEDGRVAEQGTVAGLLRDGRRFRALFETELAGA